MPRRPDRPKKPDLTVPQKKMRDYQAQRKLLEEKTSALDADPNNQKLQAQIQTITNKLEDLRAKICSAKRIQVASKDEINIMEEIRHTQGWLGQDVYTQLGLVVDVAESLAKYAMDTFGFEIFLPGFPRRGL